MAWWAVLVPTLGNSPISPLALSSVRKALNYMGPLNSNARLKDSGHRSCPPATVRLRSDSWSTGEMLPNFLTLH